MSNSVLDEIKEKISDADLVLIGIGELLAVPTRMMEQDEKYKKILDNDLDAKYFPYLQQIFIRENQTKHIEF